MTIFVFGNPDLAMDSLPLRLLPLLQKKFPEHTFVSVDPNEEWDLPPHQNFGSGGVSEKLIMIDTVVGIDEVKIFTDLDAFSRTPSVTMHDFDALSNIRYMQKLGKIKEIKIIGIPPTLSEATALETVSSMLSSNQLSSIV